MFYNHQISISFLVFARFLYKGLCIFVPPAARHRTLGTTWPRLSSKKLIQNTNLLNVFETVLKNGDEYRSVPYPFLDIIKSSSPKVIEGTHLHGWGNIWLEKDNKDFQNRTDYADPEFFEVFGFINRVFY